MLLELILVLYLADNGEAVCPQSNMTGPLKYSRGMNTAGNATFMRPGKQISLDCCITGYRSLIWYFRATENDTWQEIGGTNVYRLDENEKNQTLMIVPWQNDSYPRPGSYNCTATNAENQILVHRIELYMADDTGREHPQAYGPASTPCAKMGKTITVNCSGDFGKLDPMLWNIEWYYFENGNLTLLSSLNDSRINSSIYISETGPSHSQLVIHNVTEADVNKTFKCYVTSVREKYDNISTYVIRPCPKILLNTPVNKVKVVGSYIGTGSLFLAVILLLTWVGFLHKPQIQYNILDWCEKKKKNGGWMPLDQDPPQYDVMLYHSDMTSDSDLGERLRKDLKADYNVARDAIDTPNDAHENKATVNSIIEDLVLESAALFVILPSKDCDERTLTVLDGILHIMQSNKDVTVIRDKNGNYSDNPKLKGYKHLTYEPTDNNRTWYGRIVCNNRRRLRKNFLCALKLRIRAAKKRKQKRTQPEDAIRGPAGVV